MRERVMIPFEVEEDKIEPAKNAIREFIAHVREREPGTLLYTSSQHKDNPRKFVHFMVFKNSEAHQHHRQTDWVKKFVEKLYPLCTEEPAPTFLEEVDSCGAAFEAISALGS